MFESVEIMIRKLFRPVDIKSALSQIVSPRMVSLACSQLSKRTSLLEYVAQREELDSAVLLEEVAERLDIEVEHNLHFPPVSLIEKTGHSSEKLREICVLPQHAKTASGGYKLVVADPTSVSVADFGSRGVPIELALASNIERVWQNYQALLSKSQATEIGDIQLFQVLTQMAADAMSCQGTEVFIGHPETDRYEFLVGNKRYGGRVHPLLYDRLVQQFKSKHQFSFAVDSPLISQISISLTKNLNHPVVFVSWSKHYSEAGPVTQHQETTSSKLAERLVLEKPTTYHEKLCPVTKILLIDDDEPFAIVLKNVLEKHNYSVLYEIDPSEALSKLDDGEKIDVVISDVHMLKMDGLDFVSQLRKKDSELPVLMLTSDEDTDVQVELVQEGADAFVRKQDDVKVLLAWLQNLGARRRRVVNGTEDVSLNGNRPSI